MTTSLLDVTYIDDIYFPDKETHIAHVKRVLAKFLTNQLYVKGEKCEFHVAGVAFLGYIIEPERVLMDQDKVTAIANWPAPQTIKELQRFIGFANFHRRFIRGFSIIASSLTALLKKAPKILQWNFAVVQVFEHLKATLTSLPIL